MALQAPPIQRHDVQILTIPFQLSGQLETVGPVFNFINAPSRDSLSLYNVRLTPLTPGSPLKGLSCPHVVIRRSQVTLLYFTSAESHASIRLLARRELLVAYTPLAVCRGYFHLAAEASVHDFLGLIPGDMLPITEVHVFPLIELPAPFPTQADLLLVNRSHLQLYHQA
ncbi:MAG: hypothetical protein SWK90_02925 [Chloroflexota bacterium]|nr:hypothetical protein [Chloroflexota bacterium]